MAKELVKVWYDILAPKYFGSRILGQTVSTDPAKVIGRVIESSLVELTGEASRYYMILSFKVVSAEGSKLLTNYAGHDCTKDFVARAVQIGTDRVDTVNKIDLKDGKIIVKSISITNSKVNKGVERAVRKAVQVAILSELKEMTLEDFIKGMITGNLQKKIRIGLNKIYPIRQFEFRMSKVV